MPVRKLGGIHAAQFEGLGKSFVHLHKLPPSVIWFIFQNRLKTAWAMLPGSGKARDW